MDGPDGEQHDRAGEARPVGEEVERLGDDADVAADQADHLVRGNREVDAAQHFGVTEGLAQTADL